MYCCWQSQVLDPPPTVVDVLADCGATSSCGSSWEDPDTILESTSVFLKGLFAEASQSLLKRHQKPLFHLLNGEGPYTVFVPKNGAIRNWLGGYGGRSNPTGKPTSFADLLTSPRLASFLRNHIVKGRLTTQQLDALAAKKITTLAGTSYYVNKHRTEFRISDAFIAKPDILGTPVEASNGVLHVLDKVIEFPTNTVLDWVHVMEATATVAELQSTYKMPAVPAVIGPPDRLENIFPAKRFVSLIKWVAPDLSQALHSLDTHNLQRFGGARRLDSPRRLNAAATSSDQGGWTLFLPTDHAFTKFSASGEGGSRADVFQIGVEKNKFLLRRIFFNHVLAGSKSVEDWPRVNGTNSLQLVNTARGDGLGGWAWNGGAFEQHGKLAIKAGNTTGIPPDKTPLLHHIGIDHWASPINIAGVRSTFLSGRSEEGGRCSWRTTHFRVYSSLDERFWRASPSKNVRRVKSILHEGLCCCA